MVDFTAAIRENSALLHELVSGTAMEAPVPSCPGWTVADLTWHIAEVQHSWASIVEDLLEDPESGPKLERPSDAALPGLLVSQSARLVSALSHRRDDEKCWSWHDRGHSVGWVRRRQAHEALIHRVDAQLAVGELPVVDPLLGADGVDEVLTYMIDIDDLPDWARYELDGTTARIDLGEAKSWSMTLGRFVGKSPNSGNTYDFPALQLVPALERPTAVLRGSGPDLDLWLWGRGPLDPIEVEGPPEVAATIRAAAADATQ